MNLIETQFIPRKKSARQRQRGIALLMVLFVLMLLSAVGLAMMYATNTETYINANYRDKQVALYAAMAGVQEARDRIQPVNVVASITPPKDLPQTSKKYVIYILNPTGSETVKPWDSSNAYFDTELCQERTLGLTGTAGIPCTSIASGQSWLDKVDDSASSSAPWNLSAPLALKWVRITRKANNMTTVPVNGDAADATQVCWTGINEIKLPTNYVADNCGPSHSVISVELKTPGVGYTAQPTVTIDAPPSGGTTATATATFVSVPNDQVASVSITAGGSGYTSVPDVQINGGGGTGALGVATIYNPGAPLASLNFVSSGGQCYASAPTVSISGGGGSGATGTATLNTSGYDCIYALTVAGNCQKSDTITIEITGNTGGNTFSAAKVYTGGGSGNTFGNTSSGPFTASIAGAIANPGTKFDGTNAVVKLNGLISHAGSTYCTAVTSTVTYGKLVKAVALGVPGASYQPPASSISVSLGGGVGTGVLPPTASATLGTPPPASTTVTSICVDPTCGGAHGSGYTSTPTVLIGSVTSGGGTGAAANADRGSMYQISGIVVTDGGSGYDSIPTVTITPNPTSGPGTGATATASVDGVSGLTYGIVYQLTSLAQTSSGARAMAQMEVATPVRGLALTGALTLDGPSPVVDALPNSSPFFVQGSDQNSCGGTAVSSHPAVGAYDDPNATPPTTSVNDVVSQIPSGRTSNYQGSGPSPDVENVFGALGDTMTSPSGIWAFDQAVKAKAGSNVFSSNPASIPLGNCITYKPSTTTCATANTVIDYVDGDLTLNGSLSGYGILLVTGTLDLGGNFSWNGLVLVLGDGVIHFNGGGGGQINGSVIVSKIWDSYTTKNLLSSIGSPTMSWKGGGGNGVYYDHCWADAMLSKFPFLPPPPTKQLKVVSTKTLAY